MKKYLSMILVVVLLLGIVGCSTSKITNASLPSETANGNATQSSEQFQNAASMEVGKDVTEAPEPLDLTGLWVQKDKDPEMWLVATIKENGTIGVFFMFGDDNDTAWTYWVGTYQAPEVADDTYEWISKNTYGGNGIYASSADSKEFKYSNSELTFPLTIQGETGTIHLVRGDWDTAMIPSNAFTAVKVEPDEVAPLEVADSGWVVVHDKWLYYYVDLYNPNADTIVELPTVRITARDSNNILLGTEDQVLSVIYPKQHFIYGFQAFSVGEIPATVDFEPLSPKDYNLKKLNDTNRFVPLEVINAGVRNDKIVGEIKNSNQYDIDMAVVVAIMRDADGNLIGIESTFVHDMKAGSNTPFSESVYGVDDWETIEFYANQWV